MNVYTERRAYATVPDFNAVRGYYEARNLTARFDLVWCDDLKRLADKPDWAITVVENLDWPQAWQALLAGGVVFPDTEAVLRKALAYGWCDIVTASTSKVTQPHSSTRR